MKRPVLAAALAVGGLMASTLGAPTAVADPGDAPEQWRGYWVDAFNPGIYTADQVTELVDDALDANANALVVQVARRYDCFCNNALYPRTDAAIDPAPYDPLQEIITAAHAEGLEVHAWANVGTMWNSAQPPSSPDHVFNEHGPDATGTDRWLNRRADGTELVGNNAYIDLGNPAVSEYIVDAVTSIVDNYDVDGINLDYIRYPDHNSSTAYSDWGYTEASLSRFAAATGREDVPEPSDEQWTDWRRDQVTNLVRKIYVNMAAADPQARLSIDGITYGFGPQSVGGWEATRTYAEVMQDWKGWLDEGIVDTVTAMNYKREWNPDQAQMFAEWNEVLADWQGDRQAVSGAALYLNEIDDSLQQVEDVLTPTAAGNTLAGWMGYSYANPSMTAAAGDPDVKDSEREALAAQLTEGEDAPFAEPADVPEMTWKTEPTTGYVAGTVALRDGTALDSVTVTLKSVLGGGEPTAHATDGSGWYGFVDVKPGIYLVRVDLPNGVAGAPLAVAIVRPGSVSYADLTGLVRVPR